MDLMLYLEENGFERNDGITYRPYNEDGIELGQAISDWANQNGIAYDLDSDEVYNTLDTDIYCYALAYIKEDGSVISLLLTAIDN
jgi:hypothetical protein